MWHPLACTVCMAEHTRCHLSQLFGVARLMGELDADSSEAAEDAQHALIALGPQVLDHGQLCAIEVFSAPGDPRPGDVLIDMSC